MLVGANMKAARHAGVFDNRDKKPGKGSGMTLKEIARQRNTTIPMVRVLLERLRAQAISKWMREAPRPRTVTVFGPFGPEERSTGHTDAVLRKLGEILRRSLDDPNFVAVLYELEGRNTVPGYNWFTLARDELAME